MRLFLPSVLTLALSSTAFAADLGTYRPGTPYHSVEAAGADVCASQCAGDAQCRGWNYVKVNPKAMGVCEFQSRVGAPVASAISISGLSPAAALQSSRIVAGATNTVRVGTSVTPKAQPTSDTVEERKIVREPVPTQAATKPTVERRAIQPRQMPRAGQMPPQRPTLQPMLDGPAVPQPLTAPQQRTVPPQRVMPQQMAPQVGQNPRGPARARPGAYPARPIAPQRLQSQPRPQQAVPQQVPAQSQSYQGRPPIGQPIPSRPVPQTPPQSLAPMPRASVNQPPTLQRSAGSGVNLYGSLHDDVAVPASNQPIPADPNAPIPTASSRPVAPVQQSPLARPRG